MRLLEIHEIRHRLDEIFLPLASVVDGTRLLEYPTSDDSIQVLEGASKIVVCAEVPSYINILFCRKRRLEGGCSRDIEAIMV